MDAEKHNEAKRLLDEINRRLGSKDLTPERKRDLETHAAKLKNVLAGQLDSPRAPKRRRLVPALIGAAIGSVLGVLHLTFIASAPQFYIPQTAQGWVAFYVGRCIPWALVGAVIGAAVGMKRRT